ncbi:hypothetical protein PtA15_7A311 [Puccinia triticina]|uniref:Uncharacterized protein n=1 Tax=Puccinia triticina TaxID=208348 RepID=A0ABY7CS48_9BASI|nr:uncharacterized protein PtA15_7A311 [Puccinia triticina]WAQ86585.1 hypothetical protein PtA15_7A311 [Puccinia triticina]
MPDSDVAEPFPSLLVDSQSVQFENRSAHPNIPDLNIEQLTDHESFVDAVSYKLDKLGRRFSDSRPAGFHRGRTDNTICDELIRRNGLIDKLESSLLPSLKDHISSLAFLLDLRQLATQLDTTLDLISELIPKIDDNLTETTFAATSICDPFELDYTDDWRFGRCKAFRCQRLNGRIKASIEGLLSPALRSAAELMQLWKLSRNDPEDLINHQQLSEEINRTADICSWSLDRPIRWSTKSDLAFLQERWLEAGALNASLETLARLANPMAYFKYDEQASSNKALEKIMTARRQSF